MQALLCRHWGGPDSLHLETVPAPLAGQPLPADAVRVAVHAAGVNFADTLIIAGKYQHRPPLPFIPGFEAAGVVQETGAAVSHVQPGDRVMATVDDGAFADELVARSQDVHPIPASMDFVTAAGFPIAYGTSHLGLRDKGLLQAGDILLVHGAAGGVGLTAVEIGRILGATVIATAGGPEKMAIARDHGADHVLDSRGDDIRARVKEMTDGRGVDVVYDPVGGALFDASLRCVAWNARLLLVGFASGTVPQIPANLLLVKNVSALGYSWGSYRRHAPARVDESFRELMGWFQSGRLRPHVSHVLPLAEASAALNLLQERATTGKVVLRVRA